ncbi:uncharacterized protein Dwil_GK12270 [Drosophila willistoni]|uniref:VWFC domain-containing protein n=1 Tax=Drosophila willistoni TaxID=7260 RepID=B4N4J1_DROWI|nr:uncharacterized protein Dwil_GK12270 [Drosophila willistoni]
MSLRSRRCLHHMLIIYGLIFTMAPISSATTLDLPPIPNLCDSIICPPDAELRCPEDSSVREILKPVDLFSSNAGVPLTTESLIMDDMSKPVESNWTLEQDELYAQCCLSKKCICKTCIIRDCKDIREVVVELMPESMDTPGQCCGQHECKRKPNCTEEVDTTYYWLEDCARCQCTGGKRLCEQTCDTIAGGEAEEKHAFCQSKHDFYRDGETWKDGCYECTCAKGQQNCVTSFCGNVNCPVERQVALKDFCCPVCWPKGAPMPHEIGYGKTDLITTQPNTLTSSVTNAELVVLPSSLSTTTTTTTTTTTSPCPAATSFSRDLPNVVSRSYRPVSNFEDKV